MAKSIKEISTKAESLIEQGRDADKTLQACQASVATASGRVAAASRQLEIACQVDSEGNPRGNVAAARVRLNIAQNQLAESQMELAKAQSDAERIKQQKRTQVREIEKHNQIEKSNLEKLKQLRSKAFGSNANALTEGMISRLNEAEESRVALLRSMGLEATPEYVTEGSSGGNIAGWKGGNFSAIDTSGVVQHYKGGGGSSSAGLTVSAPIGGGLNNINAASPDYLLSRQTNDWQNDNQTNSQQNLNGLNGSVEEMMQREHEKVKTLSLSDSEKHEMGCRFIDNMTEIFRDNLRDKGIDDGDIMEKYAAMYKDYLEELLSNDIQNGTTDLYDHPLPDFDQLASDIRADSQYVPKHLISDKQRATIREGIRRGVISEKEIRDIGRGVREQYDALVIEKHREYDLIKQEESSLEDEMKTASSKEERERIVLKAKSLGEREQRFFEKYNTANMVKSVLSKYRDVGPGEGIMAQPYAQNGLSFGTKEVVNAIDNVRNFIPSDWVQRSNSKPIKPEHVKRGYFDVKDSFDIVALSGRNDHMESCAFHEMGHRFESMYPEILKIEKQFYDRRTANEELQWLGPGYEKDEVTRFDNFINPYMGKDYGGSGYELLSMGMEGMFCDTFNISRDAEYEDLILGILTAI